MAYVELVAGLPDQVAHTIAVVNNHTNKKGDTISNPLSAEREGFEPPAPVRVQRFSRPPRSTTPASFLIGYKNTLFSGNSDKIVREI